MVMTRSQGDAAELEDQRRLNEQREEEERLRIEVERRRRLSLNPPVSPSVHQAATEERGATAVGPSTTAYGGTSSVLPMEVTRERTKSPTRSVRSHRSTASTSTRKRMAELEAAEKLAAIEKKALAIEAELVRKRLAAEVSAIEDDQDSLHEEPVMPTDNPKRKVDNWLRQNPTTPVRGEISAAEQNNEVRLRFADQQERPPREHTPSRSKSIDRLAEAIEGMARPRPRQIELPTFSGSPMEWLPFKAAMRDSTRMYKISPAENLLRLRSCLRGEARDSVAALMHTATDPDTIMDTLEQCYGRPEIIVDQTFEELKRLPKPGQSPIELNKFAVKLQNMVCVFNSIERRGYLYNPALAREVLNKLSPHIQSRWCQYAYENEGTLDPEICILSRFLMREANWGLKYAYAAHSNVASTSTTGKKEQRPAALAPRRNIKPMYTVTEVNEESDQCPNCGQAHLLPQCSNFKALAIDQRWNFVRDKKLCFKCIQSKHRRNYCKAKLCGVNQCHRPHHQMLHQSEDEKPTSTPTTSTEAVLSVADTTTTGPKTVLLKMCPVVVVGPRGEVNTYALLDEGATVSLIDEEIATRIGAEGPSVPLQLHGVNMATEEGDSKIVTVQLKGKREGVLHELKARTIKNMKLHQQSIPISLLKYEHLQDLQREDVCYESARPGILVGTDHWEYIVSRELRVGGPKEPAASRTELGWVVHGTVPRKMIYHRESLLHVYTSEERKGLTIDGEQGDRTLHDLVEAHFRIDALGVALTPRTNEQNQRAKNIVEQTMKKIDGGYEVGLPWRHDNVTVPPSYNNAFRRLQKIEQKMDASPDFAREYTALMENLMNKGYAVPCDGSEQTSAVSWYLPHFAVENPNKPGKKRLVFDAASKSYGVSLNDHLLEGPDLLLSLQGILFRFREKPVAVSADIQEMFLRIKIRSEDQPAQQFLWRGGDQTNPPRSYKMTSMIFGAASSPYMAHSVRDHNAREHAQTHPRALEAITHSHYMDDWVGSYENEEEARRTVEEVIMVHKAAGFTMRGWSSNRKEVLSDVPAELHANTPTTQLGGEDLTNKILGLFWNAERDELGFNTSMMRVPTEVRARTRAPTKAEALSAVMSIYDPPGLISHYTIRAKIILQSLWRLKMTWDEPIPTEEEELFASWLERLTDIANLRLDRCYTIKNYERIDLHVFCDASEQAFAAAAYWRITHLDGTVGVVLVAAKAKVAPRRTQTIPRLELQAAVIGARLADTVRKEHDIEIQKTSYWTDSSTVVNWIRHDSRRYTPFVAYRLGELAELTQPNEWRWLPTELNVADEATRFARTPINENDRWFRGPSFLYESEEQWPKERTCTEGEDGEVILHTSEEDSHRSSWTPDPARFSKYETLVRATARVLAFWDMCQRKAVRMEQRHIERAERALIQRAQQENFGDELHKIRTDRPLSKSSQLFKLDPVLEDGILRVRGRIEKATAPIDTKRPIILDGRNHLTKLIVHKEHCTAGHANRERVTNDLRQRYWIIRLRPTVRAIEQSCALCKVRRARPRTPATGDLPRARLEPFQRPFSNCGVDYFGPMHVKVGRRREKRWVALFTCLTSRAVHLEIVASLSTDSAIMALRRMAARRGWPRLLYSDNATNFRGADQELRAAYAEWQPALREEALLHRMEWRYIPPGAPNQGGAWERLVRSVKTALTATLRERVPNEEVLRTLLTEAEFAINARPLTHVSVSPTDPEALTPNHFLLGSSIGLPTTGPCDEADRRTWRASQALADHFWRRWVAEYLPTLVARGEPSNGKEAIEVGDIVIVADGTLPRNVWPRGIVEKTYPGPDGAVRVADIRTKTGIFKRPTSKLVVLKKEAAAQATPGGEMLRTPSL